MGHFDYRLYLPTNILQFSTCLVYFSLNCQISILFSKQISLCFTSFLQGFKVGYIVFKKSSSLSAALNLDKSTVRVLSTKKNPVATGMKSKYSEWDCMDMREEVFSSQYQPVNRGHLVLAYNAICLLVQTQKSFYCNNLVQVFTCLTHAVCAADYQ